MKEYRALTDIEIRELEANGCRASDWAMVKVAGGFDAAYLRGCRFGGTVSIGATGAPLEIADGVEVNSGIYNAHIVDSNVGCHCYISNVGEYIANQNIGDKVVISGVSRIEASKNNCFGSGTLVATINEGGGREVAISERLSAQTAYIAAMYRHRPEMVEAYNKMVEKYTASRSSDKGIIENNARILGAKTIKDSRIGEGAVVEGSSLIENSTVGSRSYVGADVRVENSILAADAKVDSGAMLSHCFVGGAVKLAKSFFAEHSLFFSGSDMALGEACAIFAGPFTVSHHRSTLLIAGMFSFFNAGSGANQSNHLYRTGPVHQGIHRRGVKFGSNAYVLSPALTGAFTLVAGDHKSNHDTECFPFSYLIDEDGKSYLMPGANLRSYGTARDCKKWLARDKRTKTNPDIISFEKFSPYIVQNMVDGVEAATKLLDKPNSSGIYTHNRVKIKGTMLSHGIKLYNLAISAFLGEALALSTEATKYSGRWVDMAGMVAPKDLVDKMLGDIETGKIADLEALQEALQNIHSQSHSYTKGWALDLAAKQLNKSATEITEQELEALIAQGEKDAQYLDSLAEEDAKKDSSAVMSTGYGADEALDKRADDFLNVRTAQAK